VRVVGALAGVAATLWAVGAAMAQEPSGTAQVVLATYRIVGEGSSATCFVVRRPAPGDAEHDQLLLVTCGHVLGQAKGEEATLVLRRWDEAAGDYTRADHKVRIRDGDAPLWVKHAERDLAVLPLPALSPNDAESVPLSMVAAQADWEALAPQPGDLVRCVGYPHAAQFDPSPAAFPVVRLGCLASFPLVPLAKHPTFLVDYNTFEGDSGGPVVLERPAAAGAAPQVMILGVVQGQHFLDERYQLVYSHGMTRFRLGLAIIENSQAIRETIDAVN